MNKCLLLFKKQKNKFCIMSAEDLLQNFTFQSTEVCWENRVQHTAV